MSTLTFADTGVRAPMSNSWVGTVAWGATIAPVFGQRRSLNQMSSTLQSEPDSPAMGMEPEYK